MMFELSWCHEKRSADVEISVWTCVLVIWPGPHTYWLVSASTSASNNVGLVNIPVSILIDATETYLDVL